MEFYWRTVKGFISVLGISTILNATILLSNLFAHLHTGKDCYL